MNYPKFTCKIPGKSKISSIYYAIIPSSEIELAHLLTTAISQPELILTCSKDLVFKCELMNGYNEGFRNEGEPWFQMDVFAGTNVR